jgi:hypothetical protein
MKPAAWFWPETRRFFYAHPHTQIVPCFRVFRGQKTDPSVQPHGTTTNLTNHTNGESQQKTGHRPLCFIRSIRLIRGQKKSHTPHTNCALFSCGSCLSWFKTSRTNSATSSGPPSENSGVQRIPVAPFGALGHLLTTTTGSHPWLQPAVPFGTQSQTTDHAQQLPSFVVFCLFVVKNRPRPRTHPPIVPFFVCFVYFVV